MLTLNIFNARPQYCMKSTIHYDILQTRPTVINLRVNKILHECKKGEFTSNSTLPVLYV